MPLLSSQLARARGLGSAKEGVSHWWAQRMSALALVPLTLWFVTAVVAHAGADHAAMRAWLGQPLSATLMILFVNAALFHGQLGVQVVLEDYLSQRRLRTTAVALVKGLSVLLGVLATVSILKLALGGDPS